MKVTIWIKDRDLKKLAQGEPVRYEFHNPKPFLNNYVQVQLTSDEFFELKDKLYDLENEKDAQLELLFDSEPSKGTAFRIYFPMMPSDD